MQSRLLRCVECDEIINMTEHDFSVEYYYDEENERFIEHPKDDRKSFITGHRGHDIEELRVNKATYVSDRPYSEPLKTGYFEATNGRETFVIKKYRDTIESPITYELINGHIEIVSVELKIQNEEIRRQIRTEISPPISEDKITRLMWVMQRVVSQLNANILLHDSLESDNPLISYCKLDNRSLEDMIELGKDIFEKEEFKKIRDFIYANSGHDGVMAPLVKRQFAIKNFCQTGKRVQVKQGMLS